MEALQTEIWGWLGYLDRWAVSWQIMFILVIAPCNCIHAPFHATSRQSSSPNDRAWPTHSARHRPPLLKLLQIPSEIILRVGTFWILLSLINWIELKRKNKAPRNQLSFLLGVIARPAILISAIIYFIDRLGSLSAIDVHQRRKTI